MQLILLLLPLVYALHLRYLPLKIINSSYMYSYHIYIYIYMFLRLHIFQFIASASVEIKFHCAAITHLQARQLRTTERCARSFILCGGNTATSASAAIRGTATAALLTGQLLRFTRTRTWKYRKNRKQCIEYGKAKEKKCKKCS